MKIIVEIVRDFNKKYYVNASIDGKYVYGLPEYVPYPVIKQIVRQRVGVHLPNATDLTWRKIGRKHYANVTVEKLTA